MKAGEGQEEVGCWSNIQFVTAIQNKLEKNGKKLVKGERDESKKYSGSETARHPTNSTKKLGSRLRYVF